VISRFSDESVLDGPDIRICQFRQLFPEFAVYFVEVEFGGEANIGTVGMIWKRKR
jgi:hypothetical protein